MAHPIIAATAKAINPPRSSLDLVVVLQYHTWYMIVMNAVTYGCISCESKSLIESRSTFTVGCSLNC